MRFHANEKIFKCSFFTSTSFWLIEWQVFRQKAQIKDKFPTQAKNKTLTKTFTKAQKSVLTRQRYGIEGHAKF